MCVPTFLTRTSALISFQQSQNVWQPFPLPEKKWCFQCLPTCFDISVWQLTTRDGPVVSSQLIRLWVWLSAAFDGSTVSSGTAEDKQGGLLSGNYYALLATRYGAFTFVRGNWWSTCLQLVNLTWSLTQFVRHLVSTDAARSSRSPWLRADHYALHNHVHLYHHHSAAWGHNRRDDLWPLIREGDVWEYNISRHKFSPRLDQSLTIAALCSFHI